MTTSGLYIVALRNSQPISVNAHDPRIAAFCIQVSRVNCKIGKARNLTARARNYARTFGAENVIFRPLAYVDDFARAERLVLARLKPWRVRGRTGRLTEWLVDIDPDALASRAFEVLAESGLLFKPVVDTEILVLPRT